MTCSRCPNDRPPANLTRSVSIFGHELLCPECLYKQAVHGHTRGELEVRGYQAQQLAPHGPERPRGLVVVDVPRYTVPAAARRRAS